MVEATTPISGIRVLSAHLQTALIRARHLRFNGVLSGVRYDDGLTNQWAWGGACFRTVGSLEAQASRLLRTRASVFKKPRVDYSSWLEHA
jgi:hypothetical protein